MAAGGSAPCPLPFRGSRVGGADHFEAGDGACVIHVQRPFQDGRAKELLFFPPHDSEVRGES